jgi:hypothetical protein
LDSTTAYNRMQFGQQDRLYANLGGFNYSPAGIGLGSTGGIAQIGAGGA